MTVKRKNKTFEENMARLQKIINALETGELPLDQGLALYKEGADIARLCRTELEHAKNEIRVLTDGVLSPFDTSAQESVS